MRLKTVFLKYWGSFSFFTAMYGLLQNVVDRFCIFILTNNQSTIPNMIFEVIYMLQIPVVEIQSDYDSDDDLNDEEMFRNDFIYSGDEPWDV